MYFRLIELFVTDRYANLENPMDAVIPPIYEVDDAIRDQLRSQTEIDDHALDRYISDARVKWRTVAWDSVMENFKNAWVNVDQSISGASLVGKIVVLDFFTYCCINCMHILPYLKQLERAFSADQVQVIGVHSAKFVNEKSSANVAHAVERYEIHHPVVNDSDLVLWRMLNVGCWPTIAVFGPDGRLVYWLEGEHRIGDLEKLVRQLLRFYQKEGTLARTKQVPVAGSIASGLAEAYEDRPFQLRFPGKVSPSPSKRLLAISDSGNHRIVVVELTAAETCHVLAIIGQKKPGLADGTLREAQFRSPQGICWLNEDAVFVADTENHLIRKIDLKEGLVSTIGGVGRQGQDLVGGSESREQEISSPWDVAVVEIEPSKPSLLIAAAGTHQIWILPLADSIAIGKRTFGQGRLYAMAGSGREAARNNSYPQQAAFAQPSGLCIDARSSPIAYVADSESSSIRAVDLKTGAVKNVVGGDVDPQNLFAFGDKDGVGLEAKLQHPLAVCYCAENGLLYVADSYNHKIKVIDPKTRRCELLALHFGSADPKCLNEPAGICVLSPELYVADTNNHLVWVANIETGVPRKLEIDNSHISHRRPGDAADCSFSMTSPANEVIRLSNSGLIQVRIRLTIPQALVLTSDAPHSWKISAQHAWKLSLDKREWVDSTGGGLVFSQNEASIPDFFINQTDLNDVLFILDLSIYVCNKDSGVCSMFTRRCDLRGSGGKEEVGSRHNAIIIDWKL